MSRERPPARLGRHHAVVAGLALGAAALGASALTWVTGTTSSALDAEVPLAVVGSEAAPGVPAGGLVVVASALAMSIGGRYGRVAAAVGVTLGGLLVLASALATVRSPGATAASAARGAVGVAVLEGPVGLTPAPWVALGLGLLTVALGAGAAWLAPSWTRATARYERGGTDGPGFVPPAPSSRRGSRSRTAPATGRDGTGAGHDPGPDQGHRDQEPGDQVDERDTWDALSRGEDPT